MMDLAIAQVVAKASVVDSRPAPAHITSAPNWVRPVTVQCLQEEAKRQSFEPWRLAAILKTEAGQVGTFRLNSNDTYDIGPMQVNTIHLKKLSEVFGASERTLAQLLAYDGCFSVAVGAMLLRQRTNEANGDFWYGIGRYHSKTPDKSARYMLKVHRAMTDIVGEQAQ
ncbi:AraC-like DNA-binding protein [Roseateles asaccharophilus]|uniref:lytic transglycosylase domain-containing protein n=1 Tax=Roseateles asaccharophilus TaxID=582607 RepID=UPI0038361188